MPWCQFGYCLLSHMYVWWVCFLLLRPLLLLYWSSFLRLMGLQRLLRENYYPSPRNQRNYKKYSFLRFIICIVIIKTTIFSYLLYTIAIVSITPLKFLNLIIVVYVFMYQKIICSILWIERHLIVFLEVNANDDVLKELNSCSANVNELAIIFLLATSGKAVTFI